MRMKVHLRRMTRKNLLAYSRLQKKLYELDFKYWLPEGRRKHLQKQVEYLEGMFKQRAAA